MPVEKARSTGNAKKKKKKKKGFYPKFGFGEGVTRISDKNWPKGFG
jgi:hypothetical protein